MNDIKSTLPPLKINRTIIAVYGRSGEGKTNTIQRVCQGLINLFPNAVLSSDSIDYRYDILVSITIGNIKIGIESQGDPNSRIIKEKTLVKLADKKDKILGDCDIIVCSCRTSGMTVANIEKVANNYDYHVIFQSTAFCRTMNQSLLNQLTANNIIEIIKHLMIGSL